MKQEEQRLDEWRKRLSERQTMFSIRSMLRLGGHSSSPECRDAVYSQLDELLHLLLSVAGYSPAVMSGLPLPPDSDKLPIVPCFRLHEVMWCMIQSAFKCEQFWVPVCVNCEQRMLSTKSFVFKLHFKKMIMPYVQFMQYPVMMQWSKPLQCLPTCWHTSSVFTPYGNNKKRVIFH